MQNIVKNYFASEAAISLNVFGNSLYFETGKHLHVFLFMYEKLEFQDQNRSHLFHVKKLFRSPKTRCTLGEILPDSSRIQNVVTGYRIRFAVYVVFQRRIKTGLLHANNVHSNQIRHALIITFHTCTTHLNTSCTVH